MLSDGALGIAGIIVGIAGIIVGIIGLALVLVAGSTDAKVVRERRESASRVLLGLLPLWILLIRLIADPGFMDPVRGNPSADVGLPIGLLVIGAALVVMAIGIVALRRASSDRAALLAFIGMTLPSAAVVVLGPALILIVQNL